MGTITRRQQVIADNIHRRVGGEVCQNALQGA
jgi:hypothetical protein